MIVASITNGIGRPSIRRPRRVLRRMMNGAPKASIGSAATAVTPPSPSRLKLARRVVHNSNALASNPDRAKPTQSVRIVSRAAGARTMTRALHPRMRAV